MDRRSVLAGGAALVSLSAVGSSVQAESNRLIPIVDSHIHLFDPNRPQGTPALVPGSSTSQTGSFPDAYRKWAEPLGVVGAIHIEASNWVEDNLWALQTARANEIMVGVVGNLDPEQPEFDSFLDRFHRDPMFRGIRYGNIWRYDVVRGSRNKDVLARLRRLPELNLVMDTATPGIELLDALFRLNDAIPDLRIVVDHLPSYEPDKTEQARYEGWLREVSGRRCIHVKLSEIVHRRGTIVSTRVEDYRASLDRIVDAFGEDRILFGSDYPTSDMVTTPDRVFRVAREYLSHRSQQFQEKVLFRNAWRVYGCQARTEQQRTMMAS